MHQLVKLRLSAAVALVLLAATPSEAASTCPVTPTLQAGDIPEDVCVERDLDAFANMAWQTFKMLVWPASSRGVTDTNRQITDRNGLRVFETYKSDWETFPTYPAKPLDWDRYPVRASPCANDATMPQLREGTLVLASLSKFGNITQRDAAAVPVNANIAHVLVAQNGSLVRYLTAFDKKSFNLIQTNGLYGPLSRPASEDMPKAGETRANEGSITIKSAWIEIRNSSPDASKFFTRWAWVQEPDTRECRQALVALVGIHIVHKTKSSPQWIWATFEHVDNAPLSGATPSAGYTFNSGSGEQMSLDPPPTARMPIVPWAVPRPYNVERSRPIAETNKAVNGRWRALLRDAGSVWSNYELVAVEWPFFSDNEARTGLGLDVVDAQGRQMLGARPNPPCLIEEMTNVANTVLETFVQRKVDCIKRTTCMSCHNLARNYDFIWSIPLKDNESVDAAAPSAVRKSALSILREITGFSSRQ